MKRTVIRTLCLLLLVTPGALAVLAPGSAGYASETHALKVFGDDRPALQRAIGYWNRLAGKELLLYSGERALQADPSTVTIAIGDINEHFAGQAAGLVGATPISVTVRFAYQSDWVVYAHELGHALGFPDYDTNGDTSSYNGVMSHVNMWDHPNADADRVLVNGRHQQRK
jgi:hypothetical protein